MSKLIGKRIKKLRLEKGITQIYLSKKLGYKSPSILSEIEAGKKGLDADKVPLIAEVLGVPVNVLFFEEKVLESRIDSA
ncbi:MULTISPECIES: helix-turn-helix domain-containing protein [Aneurinibacillus]|uniref:Helix-turn-helix domain-containing protein n=1 Tax=Aneurinibacillus migulanus TaxID=47500 RepID=A0A0D1V869_ANEMI|nr:MULTISPECIES: helix-turn-helix transcriptional regulator [Aneurinibacillus]KIV55549.1 transcriptional regulator [Aneurinibacillus migulanus]KON95832.1 transcriptional regulator [Aneurinibacillus migulanus]MED0670399.1 helix-turn-helix transcriptional regulator [Aneurinibacillus aneurinilyticus]MED0891910.1 helix-turn-helix transcriptional regulator [Aneurinibacillus migulanus]MED1617350.1 helix-turn-helix transcriptional regulator [Aneurinibacillus migulanus]